MNNLKKKEILEKNKEPNTNISAKKVFNINWDIKIPAFLEKDDYVPNIDENYFFEEDTTKAILAGFKHNRRVMIQGKLLQD